MFTAMSLHTTCLALTPTPQFAAAGRIEKYIVRKAFDTPERPYLPDHVLWRQKEQFSDGVGYNWIDGLKAHADQVVSDQQLAASEHRCGYGWRRGCTDDAFKLLLSSAQVSGETFL